MKYFLALLLSISFSCFATQQVPDNIIYKKQMVELMTTWEHDSPLEIYLKQTNKKLTSSKMTMISTANYRGHIATWELANHQLFLKKISIRDKPYELNNLFPNAKEKVKASWFTGIVWVRNGEYTKDRIENGTKYSGISYKNYIFLKFNNGNLINEQVLTDDEHFELVDTYFKRRETLFPVKKGPVFEYAEYVNSLNEDENKKVNITILERLKIWKDKLLNTISYFFG